MSAVDRLYVRRDQDAWLQLGPFGGWYFGWDDPNGFESTLQYFTRCGARRAGRRKARTVAGG